MKSPNAKTSMELLNLAQQMLRTALEDLKNDEDVRDLNLHGQLAESETAIADIVKALTNLGYGRKSKGK